MLDIYIYFRAWIPYRTDTFLDLLNNWGEVRVGVEVGSIGLCQSWVKVCQLRSQKSGRSGRSGRVRSGYASCDRKVESEVRGRVRSGRSVGSVAGVTGSGRGSGQRARE